ncbi:MULTISPECIES: chemotaxis protein CheA [unclassified Leptospira]|uniref:chemotaxis protein CheA n=1 Tax=unclassified Leptospira TaxID=2633828 RepID=UPI0002BFE8CC|nr:MULTISPECIES: chemotaxis protein CheA [unclassified Leptospira]EMK01888.1 CheW-like protein [Leptospira sp. B5-022]MCR1793876.1 chemotaxis protein CheA [Leptospira sp. id769339]
MDLSEIKEAFIQESLELLSGAELFLLRMEKGDFDEEAIHSMFRSVHTVKGTAGMFGYESIEECSHELETLLDLARSGKTELDPTKIDFLLRAIDHLKRIVGDPTPGNNLPPELDAEQIKILREAQGFTGKNSDKKKTNDPVEHPTGENSEKKGAVNSYWQVTFFPGANIFKDGMDPFSFLKYLRKIGEIKNLYVYKTKLPDWNSWDPENCYIGYEVQLDSNSERKDLESIFSFVKDSSFLKIVSPHSSEEIFYSIANEIPCKKEEYFKALELQGLHIQAPISVHSSEIPKEQTSSKKSEGEKSQTTQIVPKLIRIDSAKVDQLVNLVGELIISEASLGRLLAEKEDSDLNESAELLSRLVGEIRETAMALRMVPIGELFEKYRRTVRDISLELGKEVDFEILGGETELDRSVIEKINDPIVHILRNALDHGIEPSQERTNLGKSKRGKLKIQASHSTGSISIEISDDGKGINHEKIREKAIEKGLIESTQVLNEQEIFNLIFQPGFSTAESVTSLSGRGVGMDVVLRNIESLRGSVNVQSEFGKGCVFSIRLPLTLAIIDGFLVRSCDSYFVVPMDWVRETMESELLLLPDEISGSINLRGEVLPILHLGRFLGLPDPDEGRKNVLILEHDGRNFGILVNDLLGEIQSVIKPLNEIFKGIQCISGTSVLGTGKIAFILDVPGLHSLLKIQRTNLRDRTFAR